MTGTAGVEKIGAAASAAPGRSMATVHASKWLSTPAKPSGIIG